MPESDDRGDTDDHGEKESSKSSDAKDEKKTEEGGQKGVEGKVDEKKDGKEEKGFRPSKKAIVIGAIILVVLIVGGVLYWLHARQFVSTDDAYTTGHVHQISARVSGIVTEVDVDDNQIVEKGDVLVKLDPRDYQVALQRAKAGLLQAQASEGDQQAKIEQANANVMGADAQIEVQRAQLSQSTAQLEKARQDYERVAGLYQQDKKAVAKTDVDSVTASLDSARSVTEGARANLNSANAQAQSARANATAAVAELAVAKANVASAESAVKNAELQLSYCEVVSPVRGKVSKKTVESGQQLAPGQALLAIVPEDIWILANLKETQLADVRIGQRVDIKIDSLPGRNFIGTVNSVQEGSGATFSLLPPDNATGNFTKIVQRVPVKIVFDQDSIRDFVDQIIPGLSVEPRIDLRSLQDDKREPKRQKKMEKQNQEMEGGK